MGYCCLTGSLCIDPVSLCISRFGNTSVLLSVDRGRVLVLLFTAYRGRLLCRNTLGVFSYPDFVPVWSYITGTYAIYSTDWSYLILLLVDVTSDFSHLKLCPVARHDPIANQF